MAQAPRRRRGRTTLSAVCVALVAAGAAGCSGPDIRSGAPPLKLCGIMFWSGAEGTGTVSLSRCTRGTPAAPAASRLPVRSVRHDGGPPPRVVSVSAGCPHGRTVVVSPASSIRVRTVAGTPPAALSRSPSSRRSPTRRSRSTSTPTTARARPVRSPPPCPDRPRPRRGPECARPCVRHRHVRTMPPYEEWSHPDPAGPTGVIGAAPSPAPSAASSPAHEGDRVVGNDGWCSPVADMGDKARSFSRRLL